MSLVLFDHASCLRSPSSSFCNILYHWHHKFRTRCHLATKAQKLEICTAPLPCFPSLTSRVQSSASGLARSVFTNPAPSAEVARALASGSDSKAAPASASAQASSASASLSPAELSSQAPSSAGKHRGHASESFRELTSQTHSAAGGVELAPWTEEEFQHAYDHDLLDQGRNHEMGMGMGRTNSVLGF